MSAEPPQTIGDKLNQAKQELFIGRQQELALFEQALTDESRSWMILNLHGQGGVGKSTLLDAFRFAAEKHDTLYLYLDTSQLGNSAELLMAHIGAMLPNADETESLFEQLHQQAAQRKLVIAIDTFEEIGDLNRWLREEFLPMLPDSCLVVIAGRHPLVELWHAHHAWHALIHPVEVTNFDQKLTSQYLTLNGITSDELIEMAWRNTSGYPLALALSVMLTSRQGEIAITESSNDADIITTLSQRWLRELPGDNLRPFVEAASTLRHFNQNLLEQISGQRLSDADFYQLINCSFIRRNHVGWAMHSMVREALTKELAQRNPEQIQLLRIRALASLANAATLGVGDFDRIAALQEFFYLLGDSLVRAALYNEGTDSHDAYIESANQDDLEALEEYMAEWRRERGVLSNVDVELFDPSSNKSIAEQIVSEPREPEFINFSELLELFPGAVRIAKDQAGRILGINVVLPINAESFGYLKLQPVVGKYFSLLKLSLIEELLTSVTQTHNWFVRLIDTRDPADTNTRAVLFRDLAALLIRPARFITSTPLPLYQSLLTRFGFKQLNIPPQYDFGKDRPAPFFELDLRDERLAQHLHELIKQQFGNQASLPFEQLLAAANQHKPAANTPISLDELTDRERETTLLAVEGLPNCSIAARLDISEVTVKKHLGQVFKKLGVRNRSELIKRFWSQG